jgi:hypothetical protein
MFHVTHVTLPKGGPHWTDVRQTPKDYFMTLTEGEGHFQGQDEDYPGKGLNDLKSKKKRYSWFFFLARIF